MSERTRRLVWLAGLAALFALLAFGLRRYVWSAPADAFHWQRAAIKYQLLEPRALAVVLLAPLLLYVLGKSLADLPWQQRALSVLLRIAFFVLLGLGLSRLVRSDETHRVATVVLLDVSDSVADATLDKARAEVERLYKARGDGDVMKLVAFAARPRAVPVEQDDKLVLPKSADLRWKDAKDTKGAVTPAGSNIQAALELSYGLFPPGYLKRIVLFSDGLETEGSLLSEANHAKRFGARLYVHPYRDPPPGEVAVRALRLPDKVDIGQPFDVVAEVYASRATTAKARLYQGETLNGLEGVRDLTLKPGDNEVKFKSVVRVGGEVTYGFRLSDIADDRFTQNNALDVTLDVPGRPQILYVEGQPQRGSYLVSALSAQQFDVDLRPASAMPGSLRELERYDFFILSDVPREAVSEASQDLIEKYVRDLGGGFLFAGGEAGYGLGGWGHSTLERLLPVRMDAEKRKEMPGVAMALVIDRSGSMTGLPMEMAKAACRATVETLQGDDLIEVIAFDSTPARYVKMQPARYRSRIQNDIARIQPGGGTEIFSSLDMAYQDLSVVQARKKHVVLLTDGQAPVQGIKDLATGMLAEAITVTTVGLGEGVNQDLLRTVADAGGGRFHMVPDPNSLPKIFTRETELIAQQAAVEEWFPVEQVGNADFLKGVAISAAPLLHGYVATQLKPSPAQLILQSDRGDPILARWRAGLGWAVAWTSDVKNNWSVDWLRWSGFSKFWGQFVREHMRIKRRQELPMQVEMRENTVHAVVDAFTADERFDNNLESKLIVTGPASAKGKGEHREVALRRTAPGRYEADLRLDDYGSFLLRAEHARIAPDGSLQPFASSFGHVSNPYPREYGRFEPDIELQTRAAAAAGGSVDPEPARVFDPQGEKIVYFRPLWSRFVIAAIIVFLLDLLIRRVRLFDRKFLPRRSFPPPPRA
ncbi:MAG TPA: VWA domain-containing protein [Polyangiaceae bacterium]|nr:VWA domain-containing protein [Polyangiaceae bacterium]